MHEAKIVRKHGSSIKFDFVLKIMKYRDSKGIRFDSAHMAYQNFTAEYGCLIVLSILIHEPRFLVVSLWLILLHSCT